MTQHTAFASWFFLLLIETEEKKKRKEEERDLNEVRLKADSDPDGEDLRVGLEREVFELRNMFRTPQSRTHEYMYQVMYNSSHPP